MLQRQCKRTSVDIQTWETKRKNVKTGEKIEISMHASRQKSEDIYNEHPELRCFTMAANTVPPTTILQLIAVWQPQTTDQP